MQRLLSRALVLALVALALGAAACGPNPAGKVPVSSPVYAFQAPDAEDFEPDTEDEDDDGADADAPDDTAGDVE